LSADVVVVVDDPTLFAESLRTALSLAGYDVDWVLPAQASSHDIGRTARAGATPVVAVLDLDLADGPSAIALLEQLVDRGVQVAVMTASDDHTEWARCLELGATGVVSKTLPLSDIVAKVGRLAAGEPLMTPSERSQLQREGEDHTRRVQRRETLFGRLTSEEAWVLGQLMAGTAAPDIARMADRQPAVVHAQVSSILRKLQVTTWLGAVGLATDYGWVPPEHPGT
jgi:two-component system nitrate/nitrite response regulator NarL